MIHTTAPFSIALKRVLRFGVGCFFAILVPAHADDGDITGAISKSQTLELQAPLLHMLPAVASDIRVIGDEKKTRLVMDLTRPVAPSVFLLGNPKRVIVDVEEVNFQLPKGVGQQGRGLVSAFRFGLYAPGKSRIVVDLASAATLEKTQLLPATSQEPARMVIDLSGVDEAAMQRAVAAQAANIVPDLGKQRLKAAEAARLPVIVIDPGHGGVDGGAVAASQDSEKNIVLDFSKILQEKLVKSGRYAVMLTRDTDVFLPLDQRVKMAREAKAALFISVHADSLSTADNSTRGATIYTLSDTASDEEAAKMAERENKADALVGVNLTEEPSDVANILIELAQRETRAFSAGFARSLAAEMKQVTPMHRLPVRSARFRVLRAHDVPSVLLELGYLTNQQDVKQLTSAEWRQKTAESMVKAIDGFFQNNQQTGR